MKSLLSSDQGFGILLSIVLLLISIYIFGFQFSVLVFVSLTIFLVSFLFPKIFKMPKKLWIDFRIILGKILNPVICFILYFFVVGTTKIILDIFRVKLIYKKKRHGSKSYWVNRKKDYYQSFNTQF